MTYDLYRSQVSYITNVLDNKFGYLGFNVGPNNLTVYSGDWCLLHLDISQYDERYMAVGPIMIAADDLSMLISRLIKLVRHCPQIMPYHNNHMLWKLTKQMEGK